jgi:flagellar protein FliS
MQMPKAHNYHNILVKREWMLMTANNPYQAYQQGAIQTASPGELTLMLYNGCLKFIKLARTGIQERNIELKNTNLLKAQSIIQELMITLDTDVQVAKSMMAMYDYINQCLIEANTKNDTASLDEAEQYITEFRDTWKQVVQLHRRQVHGSGGQA